MLKISVVIEEPRNLDIVNDCNQSVPIKDRILSVPPMNILSPNEYFVLKSLLYNYTKGKHFWKDFWLHIFGQFLK